MGSLQGFARFGLSEGAGERRQDHVAPTTHQILSPLTYRFRRYVDYPPRRLEHGGCFIEAARRLSFNRPVA
jgi:hypothetical protein